MATEHWHYEKLDKDGKLKQCPINDLKAEETGKFIINLPQYFDENPEERIQRGWIKHYTKTVKEIKEEIQFDPVSQFVVSTPRMIDEYTCEDEYHVIDKSEEQLAFEEMQSIAGWGDGIYDAGEATVFVLG